MMILSRLNAFIASKFAIGAKLSQKQDGKWQTIAFLFRSLSLAEHNYEIYDHEMLAIMHALKKWHHFLLGATKTTVPQPSPSSVAANSPRI